MTAKRIISSLLLLAFLTSSLSAKKKLMEITDKIKEDIAKAIPKDYAKPKKARKIVVFSQSAGFVHNSTSVGDEMLKQLSEKTKAFEVVFNNNAEEYTAEYLKQFDAVLVNNATQIQKKFKEENRKALMDFVKSGKAFIGIHAASDGGYKDWPEYSIMVGGYFKGHPWTARKRWAMKVNDTSHPVNKAFKDVQFMYQDEIYVHAGPYDKAKMHTLVAIDAEKDPLKKKVKHDREYPISWIKKHGEGKIFYTCFGHNAHTYWHPEMVDHYLRGIQYALGDIEAEMILGK